MPKTIILTALLALAVSGLVWQGRQVGRLKAVNTAYVATIQALRQVRHIEEEVLTNREEEKHALDKELREQISRLEFARVTDAAVRDWTLEPLPLDVLGLLREETAPRGASASPGGADAGNAGTATGRQ